MTDARPPINPGKPPEITKPAQGAPTRDTTKPNRAVHGAIAIKKKD